MVASRKPKARGECRKGETLEEMFERVINAPRNVDLLTRGAHSFSREEALYVLRRLFETGSPDSSPPGDEVVKRFYGLWPEPERPEDYPD